VAPEHPLKLYAFEPTPKSFVRLETNLARWRERSDDVVPIRSAVSDADEPVTLHIREGDAGSTSVYEGGPATEAQMVSGTTIDSFAKERGLGEITFLKTDAEGHDFPVLLGARGMFEARRIALVQFEYNWRWVAARYYLKDAFDHLSPLGYTLGKVTRRGIELYRGWDPELETFVEGNYVGLREDWLDKLETFPWWKERD
jgi:FkbM family methyltransferase